MVISKNSQLGLMMDNKDVAVEFLETLLERTETKKNALDKQYGIVKELLNEDLSNIQEIQDKVSRGELSMTEEELETLIIEAKDYATGNLSTLKDNREIWNKINDCFEDNLLNFIDNKDSKLYLICNGVETCSKMIRIGDNFSSKALRNIGFGKHTYLLGKDEMCRFICQKGAIKGIYWERQSKVTFEFGFDLTSDDYYFDEDFPEQFNRIAKIITFVELGDIDVVMLEKGRNNGKSKNDGKVTNTSDHTVYVVDSSWNQLIIRTTGFAVMGHFRLQSCGVGFCDRKLIWINAFEKHGYKRSPKASILHN